MSHFVYHPNHAPVIVEAEEYQQYLDNGWYDTPTKFPAQPLAVVAKVEEKIEPVVEAEPAEAAPKKKGRPPKAKAEEVQASVEV
jgi:hypothetical protein